MAEHKAIAAHSLQGRHLVAAHSAHWIHLDQPELIVEAYCEMAEKLNAEKLKTENMKSQSIASFNRK
jgi:hypothetical protein